MKQNILLVCFLVFQFNFAIAQGAPADSIRPVLDGFWGIKFGSSLLEVRNAMLKKQGFKNLNDGKDGLLMYGPGYFAERQAECLLFSFFDNKFVYAILFFTPSSPDKIIEQYNEMCDEISNKFFTPDISDEVYSYPFKKDDGYFEAAIKQGKARIGSLWDFSNPNRKNGVNKIGVMITTDMKISLMYQDCYLTELQSKKNEEKRSSDY